MTSSPLLPAANCRAWGSAVLARRERSVGHRMRRYPENTLGVVFRSIMPPPAPRGRTRVWRRTSAGASLHAALESRRTDGENRAGRAADHILRHAPHDGVREPGPPVRRENDEVAPEPLGGSEDPVERDPLGQERV